MKNILLILLLVPFLFACPPDDTPPMPPDPPTAKELATHTWRVIKVTVGTATTLDETKYSFSFLDNGTFTIKAPDVDDPAFPESGKWELKSNNQKIVLEGLVELDVNKLTKDEFILEYSYQNFKEGTVRFRFEMVPA